MTHRYRLRPKGRTVDALNEEIRRDHAGDKPVHHSHLFKPAYFAGEDVIELGMLAFVAHAEENVLYSADAYSTLHRYESELVDVLLDLLHAPEGAGGSITTGGTESNTMAVKTARDWGRERHPEIERPEIVVPRTAHPSFAKAGHLLGLKVVQMSDSINFCADVQAMKIAVNENTIMLVASAPPFGYGVMDPVAEIASIAEKRGLWMHVDGCLGGLALPFLRELDPSIPEFDFNVPGVCSISADLHKYGYAVKGISSILFRNADWQRYQRFAYEDELAGDYSTPNIAGTRSGGHISAAWAVMHYLGKDGYRRIAGELLALKRRFTAAIDAIDGLQIWGNPQAFHFTFGSEALDIYAVADGMEARGWIGGIGGRPPSIWLMLNLAHTGVADDYLSDLAAVVDEVRAGRITSEAKKALYAR